MTCSKLYEWLPSITTHSLFNRYINQVKQNIPPSKLFEQSRYSLRNSIIWACRWMRSSVTGHGHSVKPYTWSHGQEAKANSHRHQRLGDVSFAVGIFQSRMLRWSQHIARMSLILKRKDTLMWGSGIPIRSIVKIACITYKLLKQSHS